MFRGESFYDTAIRKMKEETGKKDAIIVPTGVISVWNTFFPDSNWDKDRSPGYEGTQTVNITVACKLIDTAGSAIEYDPKAGSQWAVEGHRWVTVADGLLEGQYDKYVSLNLKLALQKGLIEMSFGGSDIL